MLTKEKRINRVILFIIGIVSYLYSITWTSFAELHVQLPFLGFPLFVGEILFGICLILLLINWNSKRRVTFSKWNICICLYCIFVAIKLLSGYLEYGALACRHGAMFLYPLFALITFYSAKAIGEVSENSKKTIFVLSFLACLTIELAFFKYQYIVLGFITATTFRNKVLRYGCFAALFLIAPFLESFFGARTIIIATMAAVAFSTFMVVNIVLYGNRFRYLIIGLTIVLMGGSFYLFTPNIFKRTLFSVKNIGALIKSNEDYIKSQADKYVTEELKVQLYNPNVDEVQDDGKRHDLVEVEKDKTVSSYYKILQMIKVRETHPLFSFVQYKNKLGSIKIEREENLKKVKEEKANREEEKKEVLKRMEEFKRMSEIGLKHDVDYRRDLKFLEQNTKFVEDLEQNTGQIYKGGTIALRYNIFMDMLEEALSQKAILGLPFGKPFRSQRLEITANAWGEWTRDGWIASHNSFMETVYRAGLVGLLLLIGLFIKIGKLTQSFLKMKSIKGVFLLSVIIFWLVSAFFMIIFEMPYFAIPVWSFLGVVCAYENQLKQNENG